MAVTNENINKVITILRQEIKNLPTPSVTMIGKKWQSPFLVLISCILSLRTKDETTLAAANRLFRLASTPFEILKLKHNKIEQTIYPVGFYRVKTKNIIEICRTLIKKYEGQVPNKLEELLELKGVGRKTANLVLTEGFGKPGICVDTHVHRISNRFGYIRSRNPFETEILLRKKLPQKYWIEYNSLLVCWGQNICRPISPHCSRCKIDNYCAQFGVKTNR